MPFSSGKNNKKRVYDVTPGPSKRHYYPFYVQGDGGMLTVV